MPREGGAATAGSRYSGRTKPPHGSAFRSALRSARFSASCKALRKSMMGLPGGSRSSKGSNFDLPFDQCLPRPGRGFVFLIERQVLGALAVAEMELVRGLPHGIG